MSSKELTVSQSSQYVGPYRLEKTLGKGQTGRILLKLHEDVQEVCVCRWGGGWWAVTGMECVCVLGCTQ